MAGLQRNYRSSDGGGGSSAEYQSKPYADSVYGTQGTNTAGAQQNQQDQSANAGPRAGGNTDPYEMFRSANLMPNKQPSPGAPGLPVKPGGGKPVLQPPSSSPPMSLTPNGNPLAAKIKGQEFQPMPPPQSPSQPFSYDLPDGMSHDKLPGLPVMGIGGGLASKPFYAPAQAPTSPQLQPPPTSAIGQPLRPTQPAIRPGQPIPPGSSKPIGTPSEPFPFQPPNQTQPPPQQPPQQFQPPQSQPMPPQQPQQLVPSQQFSAPMQQTADLSAPPSPAQSPMPGTKPPSNLHTSMGIQGLSGHGDDSAIGPGAGEGGANDQPVGTAPPIASPIPNPSPVPPSQPPATPDSSTPADPALPSGAPRGRAVSPNPQPDPYKYDSGGKAWGADNPPPKPENTEDPAVAADWYKKFSYIDPSFSHITSQDVSAYRVSGSKSDFGKWYTTYHDPNGQPYSASNPPAKPQNSEDPAVAADWYRKFAYLNPSYADITPQDVSSYRTSGFQGDFSAWWSGGKPTPAQTPGASTQTPLTNTWTPGQAAPPSGAPDPALAARQGGGPAGTGNPNSPQTPGTGPGPGSGAEPPIPGRTPVAAPPPAGAPTPPGSTPPASNPIGTPSAPFPGTPDPGAGTGTPGAPGSGGPRGTDILSGTQALYGPMFRQQQDDLIRAIRAQQAITGESNSGGANESMGRALSNLSANQGAQLAGHVESAQQRAQQMALAEMDDATKRYGIDTNASLERWLNSADSNTLQRYGIDKNDLLQRYQQELSLKGAMYSADRGVDAAALHAAASQAAAAASSGAAMMEIASKEKMFGQQLGFNQQQQQQQNALDWGKLQAGLYQGDQQAYMTTLGMLMNSGLSPALVTQIVGAFGPNPPVFVKP